MSFGIQISTGVSGGQQVQISDQDIAPGLWLDSFLIEGGTTVSKSYAPGVGSKLLVQIHNTIATKTSSPVITINGFSVSITNNKSGTTYVPVTAIVMVV